MSLKPLLPKIVVGLFRPNSLDSCSDSRFGYDSGSPVCPPGWVQVREQPEVQALIGGGELAFIVTSGPIALWCQFKMLPMQLSVFSSKNHLANMTCYAHGTHNDIALY